MNFFGCKNPEKVRYNWSDVYVCTAQAQSQHYPFLLIAMLLFVKFFNLPVGQYFPNTLKKLNK